METLQRSSRRTRAGTCAVRGSSPPCPGNPSAWRLHRHRRRQSSGPVRGLERRRDAFLLLRPSRVGDDRRTAERSRRSSGPVQHRRSLGAGSLPGIHAQRGARGPARAVQEGDVVFLARAELLASDHRTGRPGHGGGSLPRRRQRVHLRAAHRRAGSRQLRTGYPRAGTCERALRLPLHTHQR